MWASPDRYAAMSENSSKALKVFDNLEDAQKHPSVLKGKATVDKRLGERLRCKRYCEVSEFCDQYKSYQLIANF